jgi:ABC-type microcin C transport system duplicated ATPase subunit YejF
VTVVDEKGQSEVLRRDNALLRVDQVQKYFPINGGGILKKKIGDVRAVENISFAARHASPAPTACTVSAAGLTGTGGGNNDNGREPTRVSTIANPAKY